MRFSLSKYRKPLGNILLVSGILLLVTQTYGELYFATPAQESFQEGPTIIPGFHTRIIEYPEANQELRRLIQNQQDSEHVSRALLELVYKSFRHTRTISICALLTILSIGP